MIIECAHCGTEADKPSGGVNRTRRRGGQVYCSRQCSGLAKRSNKTKAQKVVEKAEYDRQYRAKNKDRLKLKKAAYYAANHDREKERAYRQAYKEHHNAYCRRPEYVAYKKKYDRKRRARIKFGDYADCFLLVQDIENACLERMDRYSIMLSKGRLGGSQKRRRAYAKLNSPEPEAGPLGNLEQHQRQ